MVGKRQQEGLIASAIGEHLSDMGVNHHGQPGLLCGERHRALPPDAEGRVADHVAY
jgi:hypothetical protein